MAEFIGIDVGTSFIKAALLDPEAGELRQVERADMPPFLAGLPPRHREVDAQAVLSAVEEVLARLLRPAGRCDGVVLCGQMQGFVLVNSQGEALSPYVSWLDQRVSTAQFEEIRAHLTAEERDDLGNELRPGIALPLLWWLQRHRALPAEEATPVSLADFVAGRLCGVSPVLDPTQAAAFGAFSLSRMQWHREVIGKLALDRLHWPEVLPTGARVGSWRGAPCFASVGDQQCALAGALLREGELSVNIGTGSQVSAISQSWQPHGVQVRPYFQGRFLRTVTHIPGGRALRALVSLFTELGGMPEDHAWPLIEAAVAATPSTDLQAGVSFWDGPCGSSGFLNHLHESNLAIGHVFRAVFESMACNYAECARRLGPAFPGGVVFSGGVARRLELLRTLTASASGLPPRIAPHPEDTLFGLLVLARRYAEHSGALQW